MPAQPNGSISRKLFRLNAVTAILISVLVVAAFGIRQALFHFRMEEQQVHFVAQLLATDLAPSLAANDIDRAEAALAALHNDPQVAVAGVYDKKGSLFASYRRAEDRGIIELLPETAPAAQTFHNRHSVHAAIDVVSGTDVIGTVYLRKDIGWAALLTPLLLTGAGVLVGALFLSFLFSSLIGAGVASRLAELATLAHHAAARHDYNVEVPVHGSDEIERLARALEELLSDFRRHEGEKDGSLREAKAALETLRSSAQRLESQQSALEREASARQSQLATAKQDEALRETFLNHLRQELADPLQAILQATRILKRDPKLADASHRALLAVDRSVQHLSSVIDDTVDLSNAATLELVAVSAPFDLPALIGGLAEAFRVRAASKAVAFGFEQIGTLPPSVGGDGRRLRQALVSLLGNAARHTEKGRIDLVVGQVGKKTRFEIRDTGAPVDPANPAGPRFTTEAGLGLATAQRLVSLLGGALKIRHQEGANIFWFDIELPAA